MRANPISTLAAIPRASDRRRSPLHPPSLRGPPRDLERPRFASRDARSSSPAPVHEPHSRCSRRPAANLRAHFPPRAGSRRARASLRVFGFPRASEIFTIAYLASSPPLTLRCRFVLACAFSGSKFYRSREMGDFYVLSQLSSSLVFRVRVSDYRISFDKV